MSKITRAMVRELSEALDPQHQGECWPDPVKWDGRPLDKQADDLVSLAKVELRDSGEEDEYIGVRRLERARIVRAVEAIRRATPVVARIFQEPTGLYHICAEGGCLDARGHGYETKSDALRAAAERGYTHAVGSGCAWKGVRAIPSRYKDGE